MAEKGKTQIVLANGPMTLAAATLGRVLRHPKRFWQALSLSLRHGRRSDVGVFRHLIYLAEACFAARICERDGIQHIHAHFGTNAATVAMLTAKLSAMGYSFTVHGPEEFDKPQALSLGSKIENSDFVVGISQFGRSQLSRWVDPTNWNKIKVVHCGIEPSRFSDPKPMKDGPLRLVSIGRFAEQKGHVTLIEGFAHALSHHSDMHLVLVGDGDMRPDILGTIQRLGISNHVTLTGWLDEAAIQSELALAHAMVLPSFAEGLPMVIMEAMAAARPVIATYIAGTPELVRDRQDGWLAPAGDVKALADCILECAGSDRAQLQQMGLNARDRVLARHDIDVLANQLSELFENA